MNTTTIVPIERTDIMPVISQVHDMLKLGQILVKSKMLPKAVSTPEAAVAIMIKARELGIGIMEGFTSINIIQGSPTISPQLMIALAERSGQLEDAVWTDDGDTATCTVKRRGRTANVATFSMANAADLGLAGKQNWQQQPVTMRKWRATSAAFRVTFADVLAGIYTPEEMGADVDDEGQVVALPARSKTEQLTAAAKKNKAAEVIDTPKVEVPRAPKVEEPATPELVTHVTPPVPEAAPYDPTNAVNKIFAVLPDDNVTIHEIVTDLGIIIPDCDPSSFRAVLAECLADQIKAREQAGLIYKALGAAQDAEPVAEDA